VQPPLAPLPHCSRRPARGRCCAGPNAATATTRAPTGSSGGAAAWLERLREEWSKGEWHRRGWFWFLWIAMCTISNLK
jgi:hypothetical protein